ncbi:TetR family transcriptional regulator [Streptomyces sudanensis]|uniref:TetR/AcrR family transcriptional regulator n=1 Tax=Streptomyces sudanensis TaxID=436397 RepID=UPI0020CED096|nr:TetR family transcriptional regulator [Streptomyces sudanensis]MCP9986977.1 TetR family transcriptional regulator [Streptomyces sudanensis]
MEKEAVTSPDRAPRRSDATRAAILEAARERFAADGYERATIRAIARDAGIDPSMVMRYYGNKEGLFVAASEIDLRMPDLRVVPTRHIGVVLVGHFLDHWESDETLQAMLRVGATNEAGAERLREVFKDTVAKLVAGVCPDPEEVPKRAALVSAQMLGLAFTRYVLRFPPAVAMEREEIVAWLAPTIQRYLTAERP